MSKRYRESAYCHKHKFSYLDDEACDYCIAETFVRRAPKQEPAKVKEDEDSMLSLPRRV